MSLRDKETTVIKFIFFDAGGVLYLNENGKGYLNLPLMEFVKSHQADFKFGVISTTVYGLENILKQDQIRNLFDLVLSNQNKTDPEVYIAAVRSLALDPSEVLLVDNDSGFIAAAAKAGLKTILYTTAEDCLEQLGC